MSTAIVTHSYGTYTICRENKGIFLKILCRGVSVILCSMINHDGCMKHLNIRCVAGFELRGLLLQCTRGLDGICMEMLTVNS